MFIARIEHDNKTLKRVPHRCLEQNSNKANKEGFPVKKKTKLPHCEFNYGEGLNGNMNVARATIFFVL